MGPCGATLSVFTDLPRALAGGGVGLYLGGEVLSIASIIGFITLLGIVTRNGDLSRHPDLDAQDVPSHQAVAEAAKAPILVTGGLGLSRLAAALGAPGAEIQAPTARLILSGFVTSTALNRVVVPALLMFWGGTRPRLGRIPSRVEGLACTF